MSDLAIQVNPKASLQVLNVGLEKTPVIVIDDFAVDISGVIEHACSNVDYGPDSTSAYPGIRGGLPRSYVRAVLNRIYRLLFQVFAVPSSLGMKTVNTVYSLIATPENELSSAQCVPHFDSTGAYYLAVLHYLNPGDYCDTGLFRHRPTGFEKILENRREAFLASSKAFVEANGPPKQGYLKASDDHFELYEQIEYKPNRLVAYPGCLLHSGLVDPAVDINPDPRTGRLTANIFVDFS
ncbi:MAG: DUF6445 family protein [Xanthomonadales bacterium]|jgi:hypothetical protein|nr:DUF6445 family protein [Xanthomonadales bacterium]MDH3939878.1 DUF6445 family protein [Xanthomonadales bacterium]MDH3999637.1 DUF6445 family protein [Xanthomonadales bacterium]